MCWLTVQINKDKLWEDNIWNKFFQFHSGLSILIYQWINHTSAAVSS